MQAGITKILVLSLLGMSATVSLAEDAFTDAAARLTSAMDRARALGLPTTRAELESNAIGIAPDDNAAALISKIASELDKPGARPDVADLEGFAIRREISRAKAGLRSYQTILELAELGCQKAHASFDRDWDFGWKISLREYGTMKQAGRLLAVRAQVRAAAGNVDGALEDLGRVRKLARLISDEGTLEGVEESMSTLEVSERSVERVATLWANNDNKLSRLQEFLATPIFFPSLTKAARADFYMGISASRNLGEISPATYRQDLSQALARKWEKSTLVRDGLPQGSVSQGILTRHVETWLTIWPLLESNESAARRISAIDAIVAPSERTNDPLSFIFEFLHVSEPAVQAPAAEIDIQARQACNRGLIAALRYRLARGRLPELPADLNLADKDPWTGDSVKLSIRGENIRVYSIGPDGKDDGGKTYVELPKQPSLDFDISWARIQGDIVASYPALVPRTNPLPAKSLG